jgi:protein TonB
MATIALSTPRERMGGAAAALALTVGLGVALMLGLAVRERMARTERGFAVFEVAPERPEAKVRRMRARDTRPSGAAAPPNLASRASAVVAPIAVVPTPPVMAVADRSADGVQATSGAAPVPGPGTGAGGDGDGRGGGGSGDGNGAGDPDETPPEQIRGRIRDSDYPGDLGDAGAGGRVTVLYVVAADGRVPRCDVTGSSGNPRLDALTCRLIRERFRFRPARDGRGRPVPSRIEETHEWVFEGDDR